MLLTTILIVGSYLIVVIKYPKIAHKTARAFFLCIRHGQLMTISWTILLPIVIAFIISVSCIFYSSEIFGIISYYLKFINIKPWMVYIADYYYHFFMAAQTYSEEYIMDTITLLVDFYGFLYNQIELSWIIVIFNILLFNHLYYILNNRYFKYEVVKNTVFFIIWLVFYITFMYLTSGSVYAMDNINNAILEKKDEINYWQGDVNINKTDYLSMGYNNIDESKLNPQQIVEKRTLEEYIQQGEENVRSSIKELKELQAQSVGESAQDSQNKKRNASQSDFASSSTKKR